MPGGTPATRQMFIGAFLVLASIFMGLLTVRQPMLAFVAMALMVGLWAATQAFMRPILVGMLFLGYMNSIPFIDLVQIRLPGGFRFDDVFMGVLVVMGLALTARMPRDTSIGRLRTLILVTIGYWVLVYAKTVLTGAGSPILSALYGRDLLGMTMALAAAGISTNERDAKVFADVIIAGAILYALAHLAQFVAGVDTSFITHPYMIGETAGTSRIYAKTQALIVPAVVLAVGRAALDSAGPRRILMWAASLVLIIEIGIEFTRANYVGMAVALGLGAAIIIRTRTERPESRAAIALVTAGFAMFAMWIAATVPAIRDRLVGSAVGVRLASTSTEVAAQGGTFGYRVQLYQTMLGVLGDSWLLGAGFLHPAERYISLLPQGSIRNNDTGMLGILMTMGIIGVVLFVWPLVMVFRWAWRALRSKTVWIRATGWSTVCFVAWVAMTAFNLGFLATGSGLAVTSVIVGLMTGAMHAQESMEPA